MKPPRGVGIGGGWLEQRSIKLTAFLVCVLLLPLYFFYKTRIDIVQSVVNLQVSAGNRHEHEKVLVVEDDGNKNKTEESEYVPGKIVDDSNGEEARNNTIQEDLSREQDVHKEEANLEYQTSNSTTRGTISEDLGGKEEPGGEEASLKLQTQNNTIQGTNTEDSSRKEDSRGEATTVPPESQTQNNTIQGSSAPEDSRIECDFSEIRTDICEIHGDVRVHGPSSSVVLLRKKPPPLDQNTSFAMRPYARKWEGPTMSLVRELSLKSLMETETDAAPCTVNHTAPAVIFSTAGFRENFFHEIVDALIPLFLTTHHFHGEVHLLIEDFRPAWIQKYRLVLGKLSRYDIIDLDTDSRVHCFSHAVVGLRSNREMGIDPSKTPSGITMLDFKALLRSSLSLPREFALSPETGSGKKPRMLFLSRKKSRTLINEREVLKMVRTLGYKVVVAGPELTRNLSRMSKMVNSCDVLLGVHGAGLTNMVFLPTNASLIQIIPWGEMGYPCRYSYGEPAIGMGLRYVDYEIKQEETSLIKQYPRDHAVFTDPLSIHKQGFGAIWSIFLHQDITLDVERFRGWLSKALQS